MRAINFQSFAVARLGEFRAPIFAVNVAQVPDGMRQLKRVALRPVNGRGFLIMPQRDISRAQVPFYLAQRTERSRQLAGRVTSAAQPNRLGQ